MYQTCIQKVQIKNTLTNRAIYPLMRCGQLWRLAVAGSEYPLSATLSRGNPRGGGHKREAFKEGHQGQKVKL